MKISLQTRFSMPLLTVLFSMLLAVVSSVCQSDQQSLLLQLKNTLTYNPSRSTKLVRWNLGADCCDWPGVACDEGDLGHVTHLNLSHESITGGIEKSKLFSIQYLQNLDLSYNNFRTSIPTWFANLTSLISLNLSNAGFSGQIPIEISYMSELVSLDLSMSALIFSELRPLKLDNPNLATLVKNISKLTLLRLDGVNISESGNEWCQAISSSLPNLQLLSMSSCLLSGPLHPSLQNLQSLSVIRLDGNNVSDTVPEFLANFTSLTILHLSSCALKGIFPDKILHVPTLEILDLSFNQGLHGHLPDRFQNASLKTLVLSNTKFSGNLPESIGALTNLSRIELAYCNFTGSIPSSMVGLTELVYLDFSFNNFTGQIPSLVRSRELTYMDFSYNKLSGEIPSTHWKGLQNLVYVDLKHNLLSGSIPPSLFSIPSLQKIHLSFNSFSGLVPKISEASFSDLETLDLGSNKLEGSIPSPVFNLTRLNVLLLSSNKFNGTIKLDWIRSLPNLTTLDLSFNNLIVDASTSNSTSPSFPQMTTLKLASCSLRMLPNLKTQSKLIYLDLSKNNINGTVPQWIGGLTSLLYLNLSWNSLTSVYESLSFPNLSILDLQHNQLQGGIPTPPPLATIVDYSNNHFTSSIPPDIGNFLPFSIFFSLSNNRLHGSIPESICNASNLQVLDLSHNGFNGTIPSCLIERSKILGVLNLRRNKLVGIIPDKFPSTCQLKTLDVNGNQLEGKVPQSLANCSIIEVLDLGNNGINDSFPCFLKNMTSLRVLVLRNNGFSGMIWCQKNHGPWPMLQIVDLASNHFNGNLHDKYLGTCEAMKGSGNETHEHLGFEPLRLSRLYYEDSITVTSKGLQMELVKILTVFISMDFSDNNFEGPIPNIIGQFSALYVLDLSRNSFTGRIPASLGNLSKLESLDLSFNHLNGIIPEQLVGLTFLSFLNLSYNQLVGGIPQGNQFETFENTSYKGNEGLCGIPLSKVCSNVDDPLAALLPRNGLEINWKYLSFELGYIFGLGITVGPLIYWRRWRIWYYKRVDGLLLRILPQLNRRVRNSNRNRNINRLRRRQ